MKIIDKIRLAFCRHDWELVRCDEIIDVFGYHNGTRWTYICKKCKEIKVIRNY